MFRIVIILGFFFFTMGGPQPEGSPMAMELTSDGVNYYSTPNHANNVLDPVMRFISPFREAYRHCRAIALTQAPRVKPKPLPPKKEIIICLSNQELFRFEDGRIISSYPVSTGVPGHRTPAGDYAVYNMSPRAWSNKYECTMLHWMAITPDGMYGMHALKGTRYLRRLGRTASHGCIRLSHEDAETVYGWVEIGTLVTIVSEFDPEPYFYPPVEMIGPVEGFEPGIF